MGTHVSNSQMYATGRSTEAVVRRLLQSGIAVLFVENAWFDPRKHVNFFGGADLHRAVLEHYGVPAVQPSKPLHRATWNHSANTVAIAGHPLAWDAVVNLDHVHLSSHGHAISAYFLVRSLQAERNDHMDSFAARAHNSSESSRQLPPLLYFQDESELMVKYYTLLDFRDSAGSWSEQVRDVSGWQWIRSHKLGPGWYTYLNHSRGETVEQGDKLGLVAHKSGAAFKVPLTFRSGLLHIGYRATYSESGAIEIMLESLEAGQHYPAHKQRLFIVNSSWDLNISVHHTTSIQLKRNDFEDGPSPKRWRRRMATVRLLPGSSQFELYTIFST